MSILPLAPTTQIALGRKRTDRLPSDAFIVKAGTFRGAAPRLFIIGILIESRETR